MKEIARRPEAGSTILANAEVKLTKAEILDLIVNEAELELEEDIKNLSKKIDLVDSRETKRDASKDIAESYKDRLVKKYGVFSKSCGFGDIAVSMSDSFYNKHQLQEGLRKKKLLINLRASNLKTKESLHIKIAVPTNKGLIKKLLKEKSELDKLYTDRKDKNLALAKLQKRTTRTKLLRQLLETTKQGKAMMKDLAKVKIDTKKLLNA